LSDKAPAVDQSAHTLLLVRRCNKAPTFSPYRSPHHAVSQQQAQEGRCAWSWRPWRDAWEAAPRCTLSARLLRR